MEEINPRKIKAAMVESGIKNTQIADKLGLTRGRISQALNINTNVGWKTLNKIIAAYNELTKKD